MSINKRMMVPLGFKSFTNGAQLDNIATDVSEVGRGSLISYENKAGGMSEVVTKITYTAMTTTNDGDIITCTPTASYGSVFIDFDDISDYTGKTLLFTFMAKRATAGTISSRLYRDDVDGINLGSADGDGAYGDAGEWIRVSQTFEVTEELSYLRQGLANDGGTGVEHQFTDYMIIDITEGLDFNPDNYNSGYWEEYPSVTGATSSDPTNLWDGKDALVIGDSLTEAGVWQLKLASVLGMTVTTHALGGIGLIDMVDGVNTLDPLNVADVTGKDLIVIYGAYNDRGSLAGTVGDLYPTQTTVAGRLQYVIDSIYTLLESASNLKCKILIVTPHCVGKYAYIAYDGYDEYPVSSGQTLKDICDTMVAVAEYNSLAVYNAWTDSGINKNTWSIYSASPTPGDPGSENDQVHLNTSVGYPHIGERIAMKIMTM